MARRLGHENARRAVGSANGTNMICIVIPCHRVIRADGTLCGYGGGLWRKKWLLGHERRFAAGERGARKRDLGGVCFFPKRFSGTLVSSHFALYTLCAATPPSPLSGGTKT